MQLFNPSVPSELPLFNKSSALTLINDSTVFRADALIDSQRFTGASRFDVLDVTDTDPGRKLADVVNVGPNDAEAAIAIAAANAARPDWPNK